MKKISFFAIIFGISFLCMGKVAAQPANTNFESDEFYNCVVSGYNMTHNDNLPNTTNLTDEQLESIKYINCTFGNSEDDYVIVSFKGLEKLTGLTEFSVSNAEAPEIDFSGNTNLEYIDLTKNIIYNTINDQYEISFKGLEKLNTLILNDNGMLEKLDVSTNVNLEVLSAEFCNIKTINVSGNEKLKSLNIAYNDISNIDLSKNTELAFFYAESNSLSSVDLTKNNKLIQVSLQGNPIEKLDISKNSELTFLVAYDTKLNCLDISKNKKLETLYLSSKGHDDIYNAITGGTTDAIQLIKNSDTGNACGLPLSDNKKDEAKIDNPKTGLESPFVLGVFIIILALFAYMVINKKRHFKNI